MFDAFPDNPQTPEANGMHNVRASLRQVLATKQPQQIAQQHCQPHVGTTFTVTFPA